MVFIGEGTGHILGTDNGYQTSMERMRVVATPENPSPSAQRKAFHGKCIVVVSGKGSITVKSPTLKPAWIEF